MKRVKQLDTAPCPYCGIASRMVVDFKEWLEWQKGSLIQFAFPTMSADDRELLLTGAHPECWEKMFGGDA